MTLTTVAFLALMVVGAIALAAKAAREHREAMQQRRGLLDAAAGLLHDPRIVLGDDHFPILTGRLDDGREVEATVIADTLVTRRLAQLWLRLTLRDRAAARGATIGLLARPTGSEFYSMVQGLPDRIDPPFPAEFSLMMRGRNASAGEIERAGGAFRRLFADPTLKEAVIAPGGARIVRQVAEGDHGAHVVFRQIRFPVAAVSRELMLRALDDADLLLAAADGRPEPALKLDAEPRSEPRPQPRPATAAVTDMTPDAPAGALLEASR